MPTKRKPKPGDPVKVTWVDHTDCKDTPEPCIIEEWAIFEEIKEIHGVKCLVAARHRITHGSGFDVIKHVYPMGAVLEVKVV